MGSSIYADRQVSRCVVVVAARMLARRGGVVPSKSGGLEACKCFTGKRDEAGLPTGSGGEASAALYCKYP